MRLFRRRQSGATAEELAVIRALLGHAELRNSIFRQVAEATRVDRAVHAGSFRLAVPETTEPLLVDLDDDVATEWQEVRNAVSGGGLQFRLRLLRGGFFGALEGRVCEGPWPGKWRVDADDLARLQPVELETAAAACEPLLQFLNDAGYSVDTDDLTCRAPAEPSAIDDVARREGATLPGDLAELLRRSDGLKVRGVDLHGSRDLFVTDLAGQRWWVVASTRGEAFLVRRRDAAGPYHLLEVGEEDPAEGRVIGSTIAEVIASLASGQR